MKTIPPNLVAPENKGTSWSYTTFNTSFPSFELVLAFAANPIPVRPSKDVNTFFNADLRSFCIDKFFLAIKRFVQPCKQIVVDLLHGQYMVEFIITSLFLPRMFVCQANTVFRPSPNAWILI